MEQRTECRKVDREFIRKGLARYSLRCISLVKGIIKKRAVKGACTRLLEAHATESARAVSALLSACAATCRGRNEEEVVFLQLM